MASSRSSWLIAESYFPGISSVHSEQMPERDTSELATIIMLVALGNSQERSSSASPSFFVFGVWDVFYYVFGSYTGRAFHLGRAI
jgi:hypothetical protein